MFADRRDFKIDKYSVASGIFTDGVICTCTGNACNGPAALGSLLALFEHPTPESTAEQINAKAARLYREPFAPGPLTRSLYSRFVATVPASVGSIYFVISNLRQTRPVSEFQYL